LPGILVLCICVYPVDVQCADVVRYADVVMLPETAVGKDERTVFTGGKYVFGGVIDGVCQQGDVIAPNAGSVGECFVREGFQADIEYPFLEKDAVVYAVFCISLKVLCQPLAEYFPILGQDVHSIVLERNFLFLCSAHYTGVTGVVEALPAGVVFPSSDEGGFLYFIKFVVFLFQFPFALATFGDVAVLAEHHIFVGAHDALKEVGLAADSQFVVPGGNFLVRKYFLEFGVNLPVGNRR
jgi:hypothetical protein